MRTSHGNFGVRDTTHPDSFQDDIRRARFRELSLRKQLKEAHERLELLEARLTNTKEEYKATKKARKNQIRRLKKEPNVFQPRSMVARARHVAISAKARVALALRNIGLSDRLFY